METGKAHFKKQQNFEEQVASLDPSSWKNIPACVSNAFLAFKQNAICNSLRFGELESRIEQNEMVSKTQFLRVDKEMTSRQDNLIKMYESKFSILSSEIDKSVKNQSDSIDSLQNEVAENINYVNYKI